MCCFKVFICAHTTFAAQLKIRTMLDFEGAGPVDTASNLPLICTAVGKPVIE